VVKASLYVAGEVFKVKFTSSATAKTLAGRIYDISVF
jgi:hypothetical protein